MTDFPRRNTPRLSFSGRPAPHLETLDGNYEVVDLSTDGIRIRTPDHSDAEVTIGDVLHATIRFPADRTVEIEGRVLRVRGDEAAITLTRGQERLATAQVPAGPAMPRRTGLRW